MKISTQFRASATFRFLFPSRSFLLGQPCTYHFNDIALLRCCQRSPPGDLVPLLQTATAARSGGMLSDKDRMIVPGCLLAIIHGRGWRQSFFNELCGMLQDLTHALAVKIRKLLLLQVDLVAKSRLFNSTFAVVLWQRRSITGYNRAVVSTLSHLTPTLSVEASAEKGKAEKHSQYRLRELRFLAPEAFVAAEY